MYLMGLVEADEFQVIILLAGLVITLCGILVRAYVNAHDQKLERALNEARRRVWQRRELKDSQEYRSAQLVLDILRNTLNPQSEQHRKKIL